MTVLQLNGIKKEFGADVLLDKIDLRVNSGEKIGFVGANGCGKTTLFKIIAGLAEAEDGKVIIPSGVSIGYLEQHPLIDSDETVEETLSHVFDGLIELERKLREQELFFETADTNSADYSAKMEQYGNMLDEFERKGGYRFRSDIRGVLRGLGFSEADSSKPVANCSGGQRTRLAIARILLQKPDIMLLDEPTNHLDIHVVRWLENHLNNYNGTVLVISHDRYFLDNICTGIAEIENKGLLYFDGNYTEYYEKKQKLKELISKQYELQQREIRRLQGIIDQFKSYNREKSIKQARSREKQLNKIKLMTTPFREEAIKVSFSVERESGNDVLFAEDISKTYSGHVLFNDFFMHVRKGDRIAVIGENGCGKSTLLKIIKGIVQPDSGEVRYGARVSVGYYDQSVATLDVNKDILSEIYDEFPDYELSRLRSIAGVFLFKGDDVFKKISSLSGGEKARVMLMKLMLRHDNLLLLDEPTNHLDMESKAILENALDDYEGTIIAVSHDRYFINRIADQVYVMENGTITKYLGNYDDYIEKISEAEKEEENEYASMTKTAIEKQQKKEKQSRNAAKEQKRRIKELEASIEILEAKKADTELLLADERIYKDSEKMKEMNSEYEKICSELDKATEEWLELSDSIE